MTTLSRRQAVIQVIDRKSIVFPNNGDGLLEGIQAEAVPESEEDDSFNYTVKKVDIGSIIRILPHVATDPPQIELTVSFRVLRRTMRKNNLLKPYVSASSFIIVGNIVPEGNQRG